MKQSGTVYSYLEHADGFLWEGIYLNNKSHTISYLIATFIFIIFLVLQGSFLSFFLESGTVPDLLLIAVVCLAFLWGENRGIIVGMIAGFFQDVFFGPALGFFTLSKMTVAFLAGMASREIYRDQIVGPMITVFFATFIHEIIVFSLTGFFWGLESGFYYSLEKLFLPKAIYHFILTLFLYPLFYRAEQKQFFYPSFK